MYIIAILAWLADSCQRDTGVSVTQVDLESMCALAPIIRQLHGPYGEDNPCLSSRNRLAELNQLFAARLSSQGCWLVHLPGASARNGTRYARILFSCFVIRAFRRAAFFACITPFCAALSKATIAS